MDRKKIEETDFKKSQKRENFPVPCVLKLREDFGISKKRMGKILNEMKIKISQCQLGCFK